MAADKLKRPRKSRAGCRNCKIRKVKCDEARPRCAKCESYGVVCNYQKTIPDLAPEQGSWGVFSVSEGKASHSRALQTSARRNPPVPTNAYTRPIDRPLSVPLVSADETTCVELDALAVEFLHRFRMHNAAPALGGPAVKREFDMQITRLAFQVPVLMHAVLAVAASHDRYLRNPSLGKRSLREVYHWFNCTTLFSRKLSAPVRPQDRDAVWATANYLGIVCFASLDATSPYEAWPLKLQDDPSDLDWVHMSAGKAALWELTEPQRPESIFSPMYPVYSQLDATLPRSGMGTVPPVLRQLCGITEASTAANNPYFVAVDGLSRLAGARRHGAPLFFALTFVSHIDQRFRALLAHKDPVALLLLALWYAGASSAAWWIERRAEVEGRAICLFLEQHHWDNGLIMDCLPWRSVSFEAKNMGVFDEWSDAIYGALLHAGHCVGAGLAR